MIVHKQCLISGATFVTTIKEDVSLDDLVQEIQYNFNLGVRMLVLIKDGNNDKDNSGKNKKCLRKRVSLSSVQ